MQYTNCAAYNANGQNGYANGQNGYANGQNGYPTPERIKAQNGLSEDNHFQTTPQFSSPAAFLSKSWYQISEEADR